eukprot:Em0001g3311a
MEAALTVRMSVRPPAKFTEKTDWSLWISRFERYVKEAKVPDSERVKELLPLLEDEPLRLVVQYGLSESADYAAVHECLQCRYGHDGTELEWQVKFQARVQQRDESLVEYIGELRMLASRAFPGWSEEQCDVLIRNQFIQGVSSSSIQVQLLKEMPKSVKDAATLARRLETVEMAHRRLQTERIAERPLAVAAPVSATSLEDKLDKLSAQVKKLADEPATAEVGSIETSSATWARGLVEGRKTDMLLDTGSAVTILRAEVWNELKGVDSGTRELQVVSKSVVTADGSSLEMLGQVTLSVEIGGLVGLHPILVAKSLTQECILGADFLVAHGCVLDYTTKFCVDFRQLNSVTRKDAHPIPRIDETLDALHGACWFSTLDLASGYWQVKVAPEDREKTAFTTPYGLYQFCVMPFGLCNAPSTFQRLMELVLAGLHWSSCLVYLDDIIIYSRTVKEHLTRLEEVLERLQAAGMKLKPKKCRLLRRKVNYLGYIVSSGGVQTDPLKVESILSWPSPTTQKELRQFLGLASYYRRFVKGFASIAAPLNHLLEKGKPWEWTKVCEHAFSSLKKMLTTSPILAYPDFEIEFTVDCDASGDGLGAVLSQCIGGGENVISYASRSLTKPEKKYCATRKEMLALVWAVGQFRPYLLGRPFTVRTDHSALQWLYSFKEPEGQVARWLESLAEYEFTVQHRPGKKHTNADALSRVPCQDAPAVNANSIPLDRTDSWLSQLSKREIRELQSRDEGIEQVIEWVEHPKTQPQRCPPSASHVMKSLWHQKKYLEVIDGVLYRRWEDAGGGGLNKCFQLVIPPSLVPTVLAELHDSPTAGHLGVGKVLEKVRRRFYWVGQRRDVQGWCDSCNLCGSTKSPPKHRHAPLQADVSTTPMQRVAMDILGPLPLTPRSNKYVLVIGDYFTKWTEAFAIPDMETVTVARVFVNEFVSRFGAPTHLHTDQGRSFESSLIKELCQLMGIVKTRTTPYHPQSDGMIERFNRTLLSMLRMAAVDDESNWDLKLPCLMLAYRTSVHEATKHTPFSLMFGREVQLPIDVMFGLPTGSGQPTNVPVYVKELRKWLSEAYERVRQHLSAEQKRHKLLYDTKVAGNPFVKGDKVWLHNAAVPRGYSKKLHRFWKGPYTVVDVLNNCVYKIKQDASPHKQHTVHFDRLKPYLHRVEHTEEAGPSQQGDVPARETIPPHDVNEEMYDLVVVPQNQAAQLAPADEETQQPVEHYHEDPVEEVGEQDDGDDTEPHQVEQVPLRRSSRSRQPPERLGSWTYF